MMTDSELLELAAKAAGIVVIDVRTTGGRDEVCTGLHIDDGSDIAGRTEWNPLTEDGDALRLAVRLRLQPRQGVDLVSVLRPDGGWNDENYRDHRNDPYAATRRAIVRAAAAIGEQHGS